MRRRVSYIITPWLEVDMPRDIPFSFLLLLDLSFCQTLYLCWERNGKRKTRLIQKRTRERCEASPKSFINLLKGVDIERGEWSREGCLSRTHSFMQRDRR